MQRLILLFFPILFPACQPVQNETESLEIIDSEFISAADYELFIPEEQSSLLILFPCLPCDAENTRFEFDIDSLAATAGIAVLRMNYNMHLWMSDQEKESLQELLEEIVESRQLDLSRVVIGGFSGGGNVSLLMADHLKERASKVDPDGLFVVDAPIDLIALYENALRTIEKDFSEPAIAEANWIKDAFETEFGTGDSSFLHYERLSPYSSKSGSGSLANLSYLEGVDIRLYTEPDTAWWWENKRTEYEEMNAYYLRSLAEDLAQRYGEKHVAYVTSQNKGYRSNGDRHPHSWSIVDKEELVEWVRARAGDQ